MVQGLVLKRNLEEREPGLLCSGFINFDYIPNKGLFHPNMLEACELLMNQALCFPTMIHHQPRLMEKQLLCKIMSNMSQRCEDYFD